MPSRVNPGDRTPGVVLIGAGNRGRVYTDWMLRNLGRLRVVAVAEPDPARREYIRRAHGLAESACVADWQDILGHAATAPEMGESSGSTARAAGIRRVADAVIVATQDRMHTAPAIAALEQGYHVLLEKPMATTREEVLRIVGAANTTALPEAAASSRGSLTVCHVLRYSSFFRAVKEVVESGMLGSIQSIFHAENVAYYHFAHSYVRGHWRNSESSSPLILAKSCHDLDILCWLADSPPSWVASTAGRDFFTETNAPQGARARCSDGCPAAAGCVYEAEGTYLWGIPIKTAIVRGGGLLGAAARLSLRAPAIAGVVPGLARYRVWKEWPTTTVTGNLTETGIRDALRTGPYGRCVFRCDNNQPDHQETIIRFANGITATFRLHGRSHEEGRTVRIDGSKGTLKGRFASGTVLEFHPHGGTRAVKIPVKGSLLGHSDADEGIMEAWAAALGGHGVAGGAGARATDAPTSLASHLLAFAADEAARTGRAQILD